MPAEPAGCHQLLIFRREMLCAPEPSRRATPDSLLYSLPAAPSAGAAGGDMVTLFGDSLDKGLCAHEAAS